MTLSIRQLCFLDWGGLSLELDEGEVVAVMGESGSGKSLLLRAIADLIPSSGTLSLGEVASHEVAPAEWRRSVGYLPAELLWWEETVGDHFETVPEKTSLEALNLSLEALNWHPHRLSMGERQRLGLLRLLDRSPKALLLDEPTSNLDESAVGLVESLILGYISQNKTPAIWITHRSDQAKRVASRIFRMENKSLIQQADL